jgi:Rrf2 family protein
MSVTSTREAPWFPVAVQALLLLARSESACSSAEMAPHLQAHAAFLRRVLAQLGRAGLIQAREGRAGGYHLARAPETITLADVHQAALPLDSASCATDCPAESYATHAALKLALDEIDASVDRARLEVLSHYTIASVLDRAREVDHELRAAEQTG